MRSAFADVAKRLSQRKPQHWSDRRNKLRPARSVEAELSRSLAKSFDNGTPQGARTAEEFAQLAALACGIISRRHHEMAIQLQRLYRGHDPSMPPPPARANSTSDEPEFNEATAKHFNTMLHQVMRSAGFRLCSRDDEVRAMQGHFGDEHVWNVPVRSAATARIWSSGMLSPCPLSCGRLPWTGSSSTVRSSTRVLVALMRTALSMRRHAVSCGRAGHTSCCCISEAK